jgi:hypothetical protein
MAELFWLGRSVCVAAFTTFFLFTLAAFLHPLAEQMG